MLFGSYHFVCQLTEDATLPPYKGSALRGIFGRALKKAVCMLKRQECKSCLLRKNCLYAVLFETGNIPPPFVIEPPLTDTIHFRKDDIFDFHLILFGEINKNFPYIVYAFKEAESFGFGKSTALSCLKVYILATLTRLFLPLGNSSLWETPNLTLSLDGALQMARKVL